MSWKQWSGHPIDGSAILHNPLIHYVFRVLCGSSEPNLARRGYGFQSGDALVIFHGPKASSSFPPDQSWRRIGER